MILRAAIAEPLVGDAEAAVQLVELDAARIAGDGISIEIVGAGNASATVHRVSAAVPNVTVRPPVDRRDYPNLLASADVQLVIQRRISAGANLPSKIATSMASGRPLLASIDPATPAADVLRESGGAILVDPESPPLLAEGMKRLAADSELRSRLGAKARAVLYGSYLARLEDMLAVAEPVLAHRILVNFHAESEGVDSTEIIRRVIKETEG